MQKIRIHQNWEFRKDGQDTPAQIIDLPHDAMLLERRDPALELGSGSAYYPGGTYSYTKKIFGEQRFADQTVILEFEGVYMNSTVLLNGERVGGWVYGYTNFYVDITGKLKIGEENILTVLADNSRTPNSRWYTGSGIYRPVNLWTGGKAHIKPEGIRVKTCSIHPAVVEVQICAENAEDCEAGIEILCGNTPVASAEGFTARITIPDAKLWSAETPNLYRIRAALRKNGETVDAAEERFGIRTLAWDTQKGFQVNGKTVKLKGGCLHHDHGILGACTYDNAEFRRVKKMKEFGFNAIRYSHCPAGKNLLRACDELGMYVLDESFDQWRIPNTKYDYSTCFDREWRKDLSALVSKDYNHPSVIMYCTGNEITDTGRSYGGELAGEMYRFIKAADSTRPVTIATNIYLSMMGSFMEEKELEKGAAMGSIQFNEVASEIKTLQASLTLEDLERVTAPSFDAVDIAGYNYATDRYDRIHELRPDRIILSSETNPCKMAHNWKLVEDNSWCIGDFLWTAWDYLGEAGVGLPVYGQTEAPFAKPYPCLTAACGSFDLTGYPEAAAYYEAILWGSCQKPWIGVRPVNHSGEAYTLGGWRLTDAVDCWTWDGCEGKKAEIIVYSAGAEAELFQDGVSLGRKRLQDCKAEFEAAYRKGTLEAVSFDSAGAEIERTRLTSAGEEIRLDISPEETEIQADPEEIVFVPIAVTDENGILRMTADKRIAVTVEGPGKLLALGSGRHENEERFQDGVHTSWHGRVLAVVRSTGEKGVIKVTAAAEGCESVSAEIFAI